MLASQRHVTTEGWECFDKISNARSGVISIFHAQLPLIDHYDGQRIHHMRVLRIDQSGNLFQIVIGRVLDAFCKKGLAEPLDFIDHKFVREDECKHDNMNL